jgi:hypothetical protein
VENMSGEGFVGQAGGLAGLGMGEALAFAVEDEFGVVDEGHAVSLSELLCAVADEVDVGTLLKDQARGLNRVAEALDAGNTTGLHAAAVHEQGVHLNAAIGGEEAAPAGIEGGVVFKDGNGSFNGIEGGTATGKKGVAGFKGVADAGFMSNSVGGGNGPCAAVNEKSGNVLVGDRHRDMVAHLRGVGWEWSESARPITSWRMVAILCPMSKFWHR